MKPVMTSYGRMTRTASVLLLSLLLSACAKLNSIYRSESLPENQPHVISIDAKQRVVLSNPGDDSATLSLKTLIKAEKEVKARRLASAEAHNKAVGTIPVGECSARPFSGVTLEQARVKDVACKDAATKARELEDAEEHYSLVKDTVARQGGMERTPGILRFCAEPPPDAFTALASSLGADASLTKAASGDAAVKLAASISENAATIERTQTVNILREAMYRNCERYLSGAIGEDEFIIQASRDQQLIVQVLAVEQITGVSKAQSTALTTVAKAAAGGVSDASVVTLSDAKKDRDAKRDARDKLVDEAGKLTPQGACGDSPVDITTPPTGVTADQAKAKNTKCDEVKMADARYKEASDYYELVKDTVAKQGSVSSEAMGKLASAAMNASAVNKDIAEKVVQIVQQYQSFDEVGMTCVVKLRKEKDPPEFCIELLNQMAKTRVAQLKVEEERLNAERVNAYREAMDAVTDNAAKTVWNKLGKGFKSDDLKALADKAGISLADVHSTKLLKANTDFECFVKAFRKLPTKVQKQLAAAVVKL